MNYTDFKAGPCSDNPSLWEVSATNRYKGTKTFWFVPRFLSSITNHHNQPVNLSSALGKRILSAIDKERGISKKRWGLR